MLQNYVKIISILSRKLASHDFSTRWFQVRLVDHIDKPKSSEQ